MRSTVRDFTETWSTAPGVLSVEALALAGLYVECSLEPSAHDLPSLLEVISAQRARGILVTDAAPEKELSGAHDPLRCRPIGGAFPSWRGARRICLEGAVRRGVSAVLTGWNETRPTHRRSVPAA